MLNGKCLCGGINYSVKQKAGFLYNCHCRECRAFSGSSFATNILIAKENMEIDDPSKHLVEFSSSPGTIRAFCGKCGSSLYSEKAENEKLRALHCGSLECLPDVKVSANFNTSERCPWINIDEVANEN